MGGRSDGLVQDGINLLDMNTLIDSYRRHSLPHTRTPVYVRNAIDYDDWSSPLGKRFKRRKTGGRLNSYAGECLPH